MYPKDTEKWKQFTTIGIGGKLTKSLLCIPKILKNESNSQLKIRLKQNQRRCCVSQRYWKMKAIHNTPQQNPSIELVVVYPKDTEKWKQFTTTWNFIYSSELLLCIPKILKNESNSQPARKRYFKYNCCCVSQRYWKMKAIHNKILYSSRKFWLLCIPKILKNESNSQLVYVEDITEFCCFVSQRYWKMKAIHNNY